MGLVNRVVPDGTSRQAAEALALTMAGFPPVAMRSDRASVYAQEGLEEAEALVMEARLAQEAKALEAQAGAARFAAGAGRHGALP